MYEEMKKILFDEKSSRLITLKNEAGKEIKFLQIYATVLEGEIYCILSPSVVVNDIKNKTGLVFKLLNSGELVCANAEIASRVFNSYYVDLSRKDRDQT